MADFGRLEPELADDYRAWQKMPSPQTTGTLLRRMQPAINKGITANVGRQPSPVIRSHARRLALNAIRTYDPKRTRLSTHVINHMQGLRRYARRQQQVLAVPERIALDRVYLDEQQGILRDQLGRDPTIDELADQAKLSRKRIARIRSYRPPVTEGSLLAVAERGGEQDVTLPAVELPESDIIAKAVYDDLDPVNQKIMAWTLGLHGESRLSNQDIAKRLRLTPGAVSQRKAVIQQRFNEMQAFELF